MGYFKFILKPNLSKISRDQQEVPPSPEGSLPFQTSKAYHKNRCDSISEKAATPFSSQVAICGLQWSN